MNSFTNVWFNAKFSAWKGLVFFIRLDGRLYQRGGIFRLPLSLLKVRGVIGIYIEMRLLQWDCDKCFQKKKQ